MSAAERPIEPIDKPLLVTFFSTAGAQHKREQIVSLRDLAPTIKTTSTNQKTTLPWLKLARFGDTRSEKNSLRHDKNVLTISGIEGDYDAEAVSVGEAVGILRAANVSAMVYTSPSHSEDAPRWRVLCPLSRDHDPDQRARLLARLNGLFLGALSTESFTLSQSYYYGSVNKNPSHEVDLVAGDFIDLRLDLDDAAIGRPKTVYTPKAAQPRATPNKSRFIEAVINNALNKVRGAGDGQKHHTLRAQARLLGGYQHAGGYGAQEAIDWLMEALPDSAKDRKAAATTAAWGFERGAEQPIAVEDRNVVYFPQSEPPPDIDDPGYAAALEADAAEAMEPAPEPKPVRMAAPRVGLPLTYYDDIHPSLDALDFVEGIAIEQSAGVVYGESNSGKTFWMTDFALHVAAGIPWRDREVDQGGVVYVALEGGIGFKNRIEAWRKEKQIEGPVLFAAIMVPINLLNSEADTGPLIAAIQEAGTTLGAPVKLAVIDTLARAMAGGNENAPDDMGALVTNMDRVRKETGAAVWFVHHSGKDQAKGARGHSSLRAAIDTEVEVVANGDATNAERTATVVKQRELPKGDTFSFTLKVVELGTNRRGKPVTSCVIENSGDGAHAGASLHRRRLTQQQQRALEVLADLVGASGQSGYPGVPVGIPSVPEKWWRERFYERAMPGAESGAKKMAFRRASDVLLSGHLVGMADGRVWVVYATP